jgi:hypothetical protein
LRPANATGNSPENDSCNILIQTLIFEVRTGILGQIFAPQPLSDFLLLRQHEPATVKIL